MDYEAVIGLETHVQLKTKSKMWCGCANEFGAAPNTHVCPVCLGLPGVLPAANDEALRLTALTGLLLNCTVTPYAKFDRKNYFYPDMPKNYQTSQYDEPITIDGWIDIDGVRVGITRAHLEEDTGKSQHVGVGGRIHDADFSLVDYNRAGVPLLEIVSEPDIRSAEQAKRYVEELRATLLAVGVSDVKMEEGSLRIDANVSVRVPGASEFGTRAEIKNLNSLRSLLRAIDYEAERQWALTQAGEKVVQETRHWDEEQGRTIAGRSKEEAHDYRYFPEPDLPPLVVGEELLQRTNASLPELPPSTTSGCKAITPSSDTTGVSAGAVAKIFLPPHRPITSLIRCLPLTVISGRCHIS
jgi:aspartyl-tRNA(Asn)/glutamyl-tRNA(Gln) amidotransferase subunit B